MIPFIANIGSPPLHTLSPSHSAMVQISVHLIINLILNIRVQRADDLAEFWFVVKGVRRIANLLRYFHAKTILNVAVTVIWRVLPERQHTLLKAQMRHRSRIFGRVLLVTLRKRGVRAMVLCSFVKVVTLIYFCEEGLQLLFYFRCHTILHIARGLLSLFFVMFLLLFIDLFLISRRVHIYSCLGKQGLDLKIFLQKTRQFIEFI